MKDQTGNQIEFCTSCGMELDKDSQFCPQCGAKVAGSDETPTAAEGPNPAASPPQRRRLFVIGLIAILVSAVAGAGVYWWANAGKDCYETYNLDTTGYPVSFSRETHRQFPTPAQLTYFHVMEMIYENNQGNITVGSPSRQSDEVEITIKIDGKSETISFIEIENNGNCARVVVGPVDSEPDGTYVLEHKSSGWVIIGIEPMDFPFPYEFP